MNKLRSLSILCILCGFTNMLLAAASDDNEINIAQTGDTARRIPLHRFSERQLP